MSQLDLPMKIVVERTIDDLDMGVLEDGTPYLNGRSLATLCGVAASTIIERSKAWDEEKQDGKLAKMLLGKGFNRKSLYTPLFNPSGAKKEHAYADDVCMVVLEYYAFEASPPNDTATKNFRTLASGGLRALIYGALGYDPKRSTLDRWKKYQDRLLLNSVPEGYFSVFREMNEWVVTGIQNELIVDENTVPDISIGKAWGTHWGAVCLEKKYGERVKHPHTYPDYFPQAAANSHIEAWIYPLLALGEFRVWMQKKYIPAKFPQYLASKVAQKSLSASTRDLILKAVRPKLLK